MSFFPAPIFPLVTVTQKLCKQIRDGEIVKKRSTRRIPSESNIDKWFRWIACPVSKLVIAWKISKISTLGNLIPAAYSYLLQEKIWSCWREILSGTSKEHLKSCLPCSPNYSPFWGLERDDKIPKMLKSYPFRSCMPFSRRRKRSIICNCFGSYQKSSRRQQDRKFSATKNHNRFWKRHHQCIQRSIPRSSCLLLLLSFEAEHVPENSRNWSSGEI